MTDDEQQTWAGLAAGMQAELRQNILPFWLKYTRDPLHGGFYGALSNDRQIDNTVERSLVLCARVLWTFSAAYRRYGEAEYRAMADHAYQYLTEVFWDRTDGGMYWWVDKNGQPVNDRKQTYGQAFALYGLSEYALACGSTAALAMAKELFGLIERHAFDPVYGGYIEGRARGWGPLAEMRLSDKEPSDRPKTMNTLLHVLEGYTNLLRAWDDPSLRAQQARLVDVFLTRVIDPQTHLTRLFFTQDWQSTGDVFSYGHDIETSWLLVEAAEAVGDADLLGRARAAGLAMAEAVRQRGLDAEGAVLHEGTPRGVTDDTRHWWCQAEGIVGFVNAWELCPAEESARREAYAQAARRIWDFVERKMVDRQYGEWYKIIGADGDPLAGQVKTGPWEDPYHHARACLEVGRRASPPLPRRQ